MLWNIHHKHNCISFHEIWEICLWWSLWTYFNGSFHHLGIPIKRSAKSFFSGNFFFFFLYNYTAGMAKRWSLRSFSFKFLKKKQNVSNFNTHLINYAQKTLFHLVFLIYLRHYTFQKLQPLTLLQSNFECHKP